MMRWLQRIFGPSRRDVQIASIDKILAEHKALTEKTKTKIDELEHAQHELSTAVSYERFLQETGGDMFGKGKPNGVDSSGHR